MGEWVATSRLSVPSVDFDQRARFGYALKRALMARGMSERELARRLGVNHRAVGRWREGQAVPDYFQTKQIARELQVREDLFLDLHPIPEEPAYPIDDYLLGEAARSGVEEGLRRSREAGGRAGRVPPAPSPGRPVPGSGAGRTPPSRSRV